MKRLRNRLSILLLALSLPLASLAQTVGSPQRAADLEKDIMAALADGRKSVKVEPGKYTVSKTLEFRQLKDVALDFSIVELSVTSAGEAVNFSRCENTVFRGSTIYYDHPRFSQAKILAIGSDHLKGPYYDVQIDAGYPFSADFKRSQLFDPKTRRIRFGTWDFGVKGIEGPDDKGRARFFWDSSNMLPPRCNVGVGDYVVCRGDGATLLHTDSCKNCTFENLSLYWGGIFGVFETGASYGNHYWKITILPGPVPPGGTHRPLISQSADGLHSAAARIGPDIENCDFENMCDDGFAIHGYLATIESVSGATVTVKNSTFAVGDLARISGTGGFVGEAAVKVVERTHDGGFRITLNKALDAKVGDKVGNPSASGKGYKILNNIVRNNRARGILAKGDNGLIEGNLIDGSTMSGISIGPEYWCDEGDYCTDVTIRNNTIRNTNYASNGFGRNGAIWVHGDGGMGNRNIVIEGNRIESVVGPNLIIEWADGVSVTGNTFTNSHMQTVGNGDEAGAVVWLTHCTNIDLSKNSVSNPGLFQRTLLSSGKGVGTVKGREAGVTKQQITK